MYHTDLGDTRENCRLLVTILAIQLIHQWSHKFFQRVSHNQTVCGIRNQGKKLEVGLAGLGFGGFWTARRTLAGYEAMAMIRKGQVRNNGGNDIGAQATFIATLFGITA